MSTKSMTESSWRAFSLLDRRLPLALLLMLSLPASARPRLQTLPMVPGTATMGKLTSAVEIDRYTFAGTAGHLLFYASGTPAPSSLAVRLIAPANTILGNTSAETSLGPLRLLETGIYTLEITGAGTIGGDYSFRIVDLATVVPLIPEATVTTTLTAANRDEFRKFTGSAGQRASLRFTGLPLNPGSFTLLGPAGETVSSAGITAAPPDIFLPNSGTYILQIGYPGDPASATYDFSQTLSSPASVAPAGFGTVHSGSLPSPDATVSLTFAGTAGLKVYFDGLYDQADPAQVEAKSPGGTVVFGGNSATDYGPVVLPESGTYQITISNAGSGGGYRFRLLNLAADSTPLTFGSVIAGGPSPSRQTDVYRFEGTVGQWIYLDSLQTDAAEVLLAGPGKWVPVGLNTAQDGGPITLTEPGTYHLFVRGNQTADLSYRFRLLDAARAPTVDLPLNSDITPTLNPGNSAQLHRFTGTRGQRLFFDATNPAAAGVWYLYYAGNDTLIAGGSLTTDFETSLDRDGPYLLAATGTSTEAVTYPFRVVVTETTTNSLTLGAVVSGALTKRAEEHRFTFPGTYGQRLYYDALDGDFDPISVRLLGPAGTIIYLNGNSDSDYGPFTLTKPGTYTLVIGGNSDALGDYRFRLIDVAQNPAASAPLDTTQSGILNAGTLDSPVLGARIYRFDGTAGQQLFLDGLGGDASAQWYLFGPTDVPMGGNSVNGDILVTLTSTGRHLLVLNGGGVTAPVPYSVRVVPATITTQALVLGGTTSGTLTLAGQEVRYTFNAAVGQRVFYDALDAGPPGISVRLVGSDGNVMINQSHMSDFGPFFIPASGTYTLVIGGLADAIGAFHFRLLDIASAPLLALGGTTSGTLTGPRGAQVYRVNGTAGQRLRFETVSPGTGGAGWKFDGLAGQTFLNTILTQDLGEVTLTAKGTYTLTVQPQEADGNLPGNLDFVIRASVLPDSAPAPSGFNIERAGTLAAGGSQTFEFTAGSGTPIYFDSLEPAVGTLVMDLVLDGEKLWNGSNPGADFGTYAYGYGPYVLPKSGTYSLVIRDNDGGSGGSFRFRLLDAATDSTPYVLDTATAAKTLPRYTTDIHRFTAEAGRMLYFDTLLGTDSPTTAAYRIIGPSGTQILGIACSRGGCYSLPTLYDSGPALLPESGIYYAIVENQDGESPYKFRILDLSGAGATAASLDTVIGGPLTPVPAVQLNLTGSYVAGSLRARPAEDDWRTTQTVAGTRHDATIRFATPSWGSLAAVGLAAGPNGADSNWDDFSAQWDGTIDLPGGSFRLYLRSDGGARLYTDLNGDGDFADAGEKADSHWGIGDFEALGQPSSPLSAGKYTIRIQYEDGTGENTLELVTDGGRSLGPWETTAYRFEGIAGRHLFFDSLNPESNQGSWTLSGPRGQYLVGNNLVSDFEVTLPESGTYFLVLTPTGAAPVPYGFRIVASDSVTSSVVPGPGLIQGTIPKPGSEARLTFSGSAGDQFYYDGVDSDFRNVSVIILGPDSVPVAGGGGNADSDVGLFTLPLPGTYTVVVHNGTDGSATYGFRLPKVADAPQLDFHSEVSGTLPPQEVRLFRLEAATGTRILFDSSSLPDSADWTLHNPENQAVGGNNIGSDFVSGPLASTGAHVLVVRDNTAGPIPFKFTVIPGNHAPVLGAFPDPTVNEETPFTLTLTASDPEQPNDQLNFSLEPGAPAGLLIHPTTGLLTWTPTETQGPRTYPVTVRVSDDGLPPLSTTRTFQIVVREVNRPPVLVQPSNRTVVEGTVVTFTANATDPDLPPNPLTYSLAAGAPAGATIDPATGVFAWTPNEAQGPGTFPVTVRVADASADAAAPSIADARTFSVIVTEKNEAPKLPDLANRSVDEGQALTFTAAATDIDLPPNTLTYSLAAGAPAGATVHPATGAFSWAPAEAQGPGSYPITVRVVDAGSTDAANPTLSDSRTFTVTVGEVNAGPVLGAIGSKTVQEGSTLTFTATSTDADLPANTLTYSLAAGAPAGAVISATTGAFSWTPTEAQGPGSFAITVRATDNGTPALAGNETITITVTEKNEAPKLPDLATRSVDEGQSLAFTAAATDIDLPADALTYSLAVGAPAGATIHPATGSFSWTPTEAQGPGSYPITVRVVDAGSADAANPTLSNSKTFTVSVGEVNAAPVLGAIGSKTVQEGNTLAFTATATDADLPANTLTYSLAAGAPAGAVINATTGAFSWTPTEAQGPGSFAITVRATDNGTPTLAGSETITVTVSDGSTPPPVLSAEVRGAVVRLSWSAVVAKKYRIQYRASLTTGAWIDLAGDVTAAAATAFKDDTTLGTATIRFYRVQVLP